MLIAVDFDGVITEDEPMWKGFIRGAKDCGHDVCIVTQNYPDERDDIQEIAEEVDVPVFYTMNYSKDQWMRSNIGRVPDVVIDDHPEAWVSDSWA